MLLDANEKEVSMIVEDNGRGFSANEAISDDRLPKRLGLIGIRERLSLVAGTLEVEIRARSRLHTLYSCAAMNAPTALRVLVADDHPVVLAGIRALLNRNPGVEIIGEAHDGRTALQMAIELQPSILVLDFSMPDLNGVEVTKRLLAERPHSKVIVLTVHEDRSYLRKLIEVGAVGYVLKRSAADDLLRAIQAVAAGGVYLDPSIAGHAIDRTPNRLKETTNGRAELSEREVEVLRLTAVGHSNKAIANILRISVKSVETYKARAMDKLGFRSRVELVGYAVEKGWLMGA